MSEEIPVVALVSGGKATGGPPLGPALGPLGVNTGAVVAKINELTQEYAGLKVPGIVWVDKSKKPAAFRVEVGTPPVSALMIKELGIEKGSGEPNKTKVGDLSMDLVVKIAKTKRAKMTAKTFKAAVKTVLGTAVSLGVTIDGGKDPRVVQQMVDDGEYDAVIVE